MHFFHKMTTGNHFLILYDKIYCRTLKPKENLEFREDGTKLRYQARSRYFFDKERSEGNDPTVDVIINVNYIILVRGGTCYPESNAHRTRMPFSPRCTIRVTLDQKFFLQ